MRPPENSQNSCNRISGATRSNVGLMGSRRPRRRPPFPMTPESAGSPFVQEYISRSLQARAGKQWRQPMGVRTWGAVVSAEMFHLTRHEKIPPHRIEMEWYDARLAG